jgi:hypothetical protein
MGDGVYETKDGHYQIQNPRKMDPDDPDGKWYIIEMELESCEAGPFDTLKEARHFLVTKR